MHLTRKIKREKKKDYTPEQEQLSPLPPSFTIEEGVICSGCFQQFSFDHKKIKCPRCDKLFHCKISADLHGCVSCEPQICLTGDQPSPSTEDPAEKTTDSPQMSINVFSEI
tara:strand:+ start:1040 stop:1372 length:333 start_codon:yes stop_codon:yes gene_type:complete